MAATLGEPPRPVIVVPGFGVTKLFDPVTRRYVWGTGHATFQTRYEDDLDLPVNGHDRLIPHGYVGSRGPINIGWQITEGLRKFGRYVPGRTVFPFYYDWRLSARHNAARLAEVVETVRAGGSVDIVAHSAGAIVALTYVKLGGAEHVDHLVLIAPTQLGVVDAFRILVRPERFIRRVFTTEMVETWPSVPELLPEDGRFVVDQSGHPTGFDAWNPERWRTIIGTTTAFERSIAEARRFRDELRRAPMPAAVKVTVLAGDCVETAHRVLLRRDGSFVFYPGELRGVERGLASELFEPGDGTVPISSARAGGSATTFCDGHQGIAADPNVQHALIQTLRQ
ncbi:MAG TPA: alpha/beta fold hydrolase [Thermoanaerobaculia bacterium]|nr:alpha/beta fold hydrolase [Thermoanaerobaculia bacterium]